MATGAKHDTKQTQNSCDTATAMYYLLLYAIRDQCARSDVSQTVSAHRQRSRDRSVCVTPSCWSLFFVFYVPSVITIPVHTQRHSIYITCGSYAYDTCSSNITALSIWVGHRRSTRILAVRVYWLRAPLLNRKTHRNLTEKKSENIIKRHPIYLYNTFKYKGKPYTEL